MEILILQRLPDIKHFICSNYRTNRTVENVQKYTVKEKNK